MKVLLSSLFLLSLAGCSPEQQKGQVTATAPPADTVINPPPVLQRAAMATDAGTTGSVPASVAPDSIAIAAGEGVYLLEPTSYHNDEVTKEWENLRWYGVFKLPDGAFEVRATRISIEQTRDDLVDDEGAETGWQVKVADKDTALFLVGGKITLTPKKTTGKAPEYQILQPDSLLTLDRQYRLKASGGSRPYKDWDEKEVFNYGLQLIGGGRQQKLLSDYKFIGDGPYVVWHGYLDDDAVPDLLIDCKLDYNQRILVLFLSSRAGAGQMVRPVAKMESVGC
jgi:hypothetical protein